MPQSLPRYTLNKTLAKLLTGCLVTCSTAARAQTRVIDDSQSLRTKEARVSAQVVRDYYRARDHFTFASARLLVADDLVLVNKNGEESKAHSETLQAFMDYEKYMHGRWHCTILAFHDGIVEAEVIEKNDYYRYLGSGHRILRERFTVAGGKICRIQTISDRYDGDDQDITYHRFVEWINEVHPDKVHSVLPSGHLIFDGGGAREQLPLLKEFASRKKPN